MTGNVQTNLRCCKPEGFEDALYPGYWIVPSIGEIEKPVVCRIRQVMEGGMVEFIHPLNGSCIGSAGINWADKYIVRLDEYLHTAAVLGP